MPFDITFTVKESVANGRRLMRGDDGATFWEPAEMPPPPAPADSLAAAPVPTFSKSVTKRVKAQTKRLIHG